MIFYVVSCEIMTLLSAVLAMYRKSDESGTVDYSITRWSESVFPYWTAFIVCTLYRRIIE